MTAIHLARRSMEKEMVEFLIKSDADVNIKSINHERTINNLNEKMAELLIFHGIKISTKKRFNTSRHS
ncbi:hypothetical protein TVAG_032920 [Trichomonas vaginalis G3]|uniref:Uncharacterized protein n=1 Tax=Trichomonas vaginalis (strain ATCC PRA-98 / G3) TaxID=412133 RepID=A2FAZ2_TRIV3|nr:Ankyrin repeat family [Trichomonas vaginalis G3]EAX97920.1 hypothetical protein TVAG_032920 [Trichomonas vaginalis G3]KAI5541279.1 Ankyrin repeat family [Trichomonas vaginalis G3]|eukprot:XP_001310850.1 hypothetical protein [Trichomonas vaginalis G3]